jgi:FKBP12-rapamycin complex-associated protein
MTDMYKDVCDITLRLKDARDALIRKTVVSIIPTLASYDPATFSELYLHKSMSHLLNLLRKSNEKRDGKNNINQQNYA